MISVPEALKLILESAPTMPTESLALEELCGRVLAEPLHSPIDLPIFTNSAVDGYAVRAEDASEGATLTVAGAIAAGEQPTAKVRKGQAVRVFTGSAIPEGADAVIMQEDVVLGQESLQAICIKRPVAQGSCIRVKGEEVESGDLVLQPGILITPPVIGVIATLGLSQANVFKRPRVGILGTGSELVPPGQPLKPGQIYQSNTHAISAAVRMAGGLLGNASSVRDDRESLRLALKQAIEANDAVITCGGVSVGDHDLVREVAQELGVTEVFWRVAMRPGKPFYFAMTADGKPVFGLPGNPVSALVTFYLLVRPALLKMMGIDTAERWETATLGTGLTKQKGRAEFLRAKKEPGSDVFVPTEGQGSHMLTGLADAEYLIHLPDSMESCQKGEQVSAVRLNWRLG